MRAVAKGVRRTSVAVRRAARAVHATSTSSCTTGARSTSSRRPRRSAPFGAAIAADYARYTAGTAMLETAERLTETSASRPCSCSCCWSAGSGRSRTGDPTPAWCSTPSCCGRSRSPAGRRSFDDCARCGEAGPAPRLRHRGRWSRLPRRAARRARPRPARRPSCCSRALLARRLGRRRCQRAAATGARPAASSPRYLQWHLERQLRSLRLVERVSGDPRPRRCADGETRGDQPRRDGGPPARAAGSRRTRPASVPPAIPPEFVPRHVAVVMDGNGRWANARGLPRTRVTRAGEASLFDVVAGAIDLASQYVSAYAFSTENWRRSPDEVRFLMGFNRDVIRRRGTSCDSMGRPRPVGRRRPGCGAASSTSWRTPRSSTRSQRRADPDHVRQLRRAGRDR